VSCIVELEKRGLEEETEVDAQQALEAEEISEEEVQTADENDETENNKTKAVIGIFGIFAAIGVALKKIFRPVAEFFDRLTDKYNAWFERFETTKFGKFTAKLDKEIYCRSYVFGARIKRNNRIVKRRLAAWSYNIRSGISDSWHRSVAHVRLSWLNFWDRRFAAIRITRTRIKMSLKKIRAAENRKIFVYIKESVKILLALLNPVWRLIIGIVNYALPIAAALLLVSVIQYFNSLTFAFSVEYDGEIIGYIENETKFDEAERAVKDRLINEEYLQPGDSVPRFTLCVIDKNNFTSVETLANRIIKASGNAVETAYGLYVDDEFVGATTDKNALLDILDARLEAYRTDIDGEVVSFVNKIRLSEGIYPETSILPVSSIEQQLNSEVEGERYYTVVRGDTPIKIANKNNMKLADLKALNPDIMTSLYAGDEILISKSEPFLGIKVTRRETYEIEVPYGTERVSDNTLYSGVTSVKSKGVNGRSEQVADVTYVDGVEVERNVLSTTEITAPVNQVLSVGTYIAKPSGNQGQQSGSSNASGFIWPTAARKISCYWLGYPGHYGLDIAGPRGTDIYAAAPGTVMFVRRYYYGYGLHLKIDHGGGVQTLYAHCSNVFVTKGDFVRQGQKIAAIGMTGRATGYHLHFEIHINGKQQNPLPYIR